MPDLAGAAPAGGYGPPRRAMSGPAGLSTITRPSRHRRVSSHRSPAPASAGRAVRATMPTRRTRTNAVSPAQTPPIPQCQCSAARLQRREEAHCGDDRDACAGTRRHRRRSARRPARTPPRPPAASPTNHGHSTCAWCRTSGAEVNSLGQHRPRRGVQGAANPTPAYSAPPGHLPGERPGAGRRRTPPSAAPTSDCARDGERVEQQRGELPQLQADLVRGDLRGAHPRRDARRPRGTRPGTRRRARSGRGRPRPGRGSPQRCGRQRRPRRGAAPAGTGRRRRPARRRSRSPSRPAPARPGTPGSATPRPTSAFASHDDHAPARGCAARRASSRCRRAPAGRRAGRARRCGTRSRRRAGWRRPAGEQRCQRPGERLADGGHQHADPSASQEACTPSFTAASRRPAPNHRAARPVVPYSTNVPRIVSSDISAAPTPSPASGVLPRCPTMAVSTRGTAVRLQAPGRLMRTAPAGPWCPGQRSPVTRPGT